MSHLVRGPALENKSEAPFDARILRVHGQQAFAMLEIQGEGFGGTVAKLSRKRGGHNQPHVTWVMVLTKFALRQPLPRIVSSRCETVGFSNKKTNHTGLGRVAHSPHEEGVIYICYSYAISYLPSPRPSPRYRPDLLKLHLIARRKKLFI